MVTAQDFILKINTEYSSFERFGDEVVVVNFLKGKYYNLEGTAGVIWDLLFNGMTLSQLIDCLAKLYQIDTETISPHISSFIEQLKDEQLLTLAASTDEVEPEPTEVSSPFSPPLLQVFDDLQDLVILDPIHDVEAERGWPARSDPS